MAFIEPLVNTDGKSRVVKTTRQQGPITSQLLGRRCTSLKHCLLLFVYLEFVGFQQQSLILFMEVALPFLGWRKCFWDSRFACHLWLIL